MALTIKQLGVLRGIMIGWIIAFAVIALGIVNPFMVDESLADIERIKLAIKSLIFPAFFLVIPIIRLAKHRFFTLEDMDGDGLCKDTAQAQMLQSLLQNTIEQFSLVAITYIAWALIMPTSYVATIPIAATTFVIGRIIFLVGYKYGAPSRALGFTLTFYPSLLMLFCTIVYVVLDFTKVL